ncbi:MAG TPA: hypothetical protein VFQ91_15930 [Bryobacteraceae bacterium]|nr:hypothetical protein [Bryobacteraceae bacterium]
MRILLAITLLFTAGCDAFRKGYERGFNRSFLESCQQTVVKEGGTEARAKTYCDCTLAKMHGGASIDDAAGLCR